jgi:hypothetical protein
MSQKAIYVFQDSLDPSGTADDDESARRLPRWGLVPCQVHEDFMDHRSTLIGYYFVKALSTQSSFLSLRRLATA